MQGLLTPFDCLEGFERKVMKRPSAPKPPSGGTAAERSRGEASTSGETCAKYPKHLPLQADCQCECHLAGDDTKGGWFQPPSTE